MHTSSQIEFHKFETDNASCPLGKLAADKPNKQIRYLKSYLTDLDTSSIMIENYFDRDYLSEFSKFYSMSTRGYTNICKRYHFFKGPLLNRENFTKAAEGDAEMIKTLNQNYLGFCTIRPITATPLGRTVLKWYEDKHPEKKRIVQKRDYTCHVAGINLTVEGIAWQQQDTGVGSCSTIALWSALQSMAFDEFHSVPTTTEITEAANRKTTLGARVFPSTGLTPLQLCEAINELDLSPMIINGELPNQTFSKEKFMSSTASYIRSGYPVIAIGQLGKQELHAVCIVGFRENPIASAATKITLQDSNAEVVYLHDDNIGPNVRCALFEKTITGSNPHQRVYFKPAPPEIQYTSASTAKSAIESYEEFTPNCIVIAVHKDLRTSPDSLHRKGLEAADQIQRALSHITEQNSKPKIPINLSTCFFKLEKYLNTELERILGSDPKTLGQTRLALWEQVRPMSQHLGVVRVGSNNTPLIDIIYDTTDTERNLPAFTHVIFNDTIEEITKILTEKKGINWGTAVRAYSQKSLT